MAWPAHKSHRSWSPSSRIRSLNIGRAEGFLGLSCPPCLDNSNASDALANLTETLRRIATLGRAFWCPRPSALPHASAGTNEAQVFPLRSPFGHVGCVDRVPRLPPCFGPTEPPCPPATKPAPTTWSSLAKDGPLTPPAA